MSTLSTSLHIPQPCQESWAAMTPAATGRHCAACQQTIVDFTQQTDAEILAHLARAASGQTCGRFRASQLGRPLTPPAAPTRWRAWLGALLATSSLLGSERAGAQSTTQHTSGGPVPLASQPASTPAAPVAPATPEAPAAAATHEPLTLRGVVTDARNSALPGVTVLLKGTTQGTSTDVNGAFTLPITGNAPNPVLIVSFVGFVTCEQPVAIEATGAVAPVRLELEEDVMGMLLSPRPYPWHPRAFFNWGKYWLTRPFRQ